MPRRLVRVPLLLLALGGCYKAPTDAWQPVRVAIHNVLTEPVTIVAGGITYGTFSPGWTYLALPHGASTLTWTANAPLYSDSSAVPSDLTAQTVALGAGPDTVVIANVVNGLAYFSPWLYNWTGVGVDVAIVDSGARRLCFTLGTSNFHLAYYLLTGTVEIHVYRAATSCTGTYLTVSNATLAAYQPNSGLVQVNITAAP